MAAPLAVGRGGLAPGGVIVITDDGRGVARSMAGELEAAASEGDIGSHDFHDCRRRGCAPGRVLPMQASTRHFLLTTWTLGA